MSGTRGIGRRRGTRGKTVLVNGIPEGATVNTEPAYTPTQEIPAVTAEIHLTFDGSQFEEALTAVIADAAPIPNIDSICTADRQAWFDAHGGSEPLFASVVADLEAAYLLDTSLPVPVRSAPDAAEAPDAVPEAARPPASEDSGTAAPQAPPVASGTVSTEDEPVAEADCAENGEVA